MANARRTSTRALSPLVSRLHLLVKPPPDRRQASIDEVIERRFRVINPLVTPGEFPRLRAQFRGRKADLIRLISQQWGVAPRTIHHWLRAFKRGGMAALAKRQRSDVDLPQALNVSALEFLLTIAVPGPITEQEKTIAEIHRAYLSEGDRRRARPDQFKPEQQLPKVAYETVRVWLANIPNLVRVIEKAKRSLATQL